MSNSSTPRQSIQPVNMSITTISFSMPPSDDIIDNTDLPYDDEVEDEVETIYLSCPICKYKTLTKYGIFQTCVICGWEEDGNKDRKEEILGGPNKDYSINEAIQNFYKYLTIYRPTDKYMFKQMTEIEILYKKEQVCIGLEERDLGPENMDDCVDFDKILETVAIVRAEMELEDLKLLDEQPKIDQSLTEEEPTTN